MAAVTIGGHSPWIMARWAMAALMQRASTFLDSDGDREMLVAAQALDGLHFELLEQPERQRIAAAVQAAAEDLSRERRTSDEPRDSEFADLLDDLSLCLTETAHAAGAP